MSIKPFISIIIPVYNGEKYINRLIDSITNQDYENYEIIIVNDGSTDKTKDILDNINNDKIKVYHQKNGGASSARNYGIKKSSGKYILFADSDDFYNENLFKKIVPYLEIGEYDLYYFNFNNYYNNNQYYTEYKYEEYEKIIGNNEPFYMYLNGEYTINLKRFPCNKIYKREIDFKQKNHETYFKYDTHWNFYGAYIGVKKIMEYIDSDFMMPYESINYSEYGGDLANMNLMTGILNKEPNVSFMNDITVNCDNQEINYCQSNGLKDQKIMVIGDSFSNLMTNYFSKIYSNSIFVKRVNYHSRLIDIYKPDIIVYEVVERYSYELKTIDCLTN